MWYRTKIKNHECRKKLISKLVKECSQNIDAN